MQLWRSYERAFVRSVARGAGKVVARAATVDGARKPLSWLRDEFFLGLTDELEDLGVSRRVAAGMFGVSRRTYLRQLQSAGGGLESPGESLWWGTLKALRQKPMSREDVLARFSHRPPQLIGAILFDMTESGVIELDSEQRYTAVEDRDLWTTGRLRNLLAMLRASSGVPALDELVATLDVDPDRVSEALDELNNSRFTVEDPEYETLWEVLRLCVGQALLSAYRELAREATDGFVFRIALAQRGLDEVPRLRAVVDAAREQMKDGLAEMLDEAADHVANDAVFTATIIHLMEDDDWLS